MNEAVVLVDKISFSRPLFDCYGSPPTGSAEAKRMGSRECLARAPSAEVRLLLMR
jgi:hypothetical protein